MNNADKKILLKLARDSIKTYFKGKKPDMKEAKHLSDKQGVFVTLHDKDGDLRGCIGFPMPVYPLNMAVVEVARSAAFHDPRFPPLEEKELDKIVIEISVLTLPEPVKVERASEYMEKIKIGVDGLIIDGEYGSGLLLPQVATENNFNVQTFLNCLCQKAGMGFNCWKDLNNKISKFQAIIFNEKDIK
ncbi:AmmeMemoRadiSam system protein A [Candidatus Woesearchaeota archaeon]|nr:AmmeMemoRadiSam system protein A [Candidatus Woesearchaeota archaeon]